MLRQPIVQLVLLWLVLSAALGLAVPDGDSGARLNQWQEPRASVAAAASRVFVPQAATGAAALALPPAVPSTAQPRTATPSPIRPTPTRTPPIGPTAAPSATSRPVPRRMYGVLFGDNRYLQSDWQAGVRVREVELSWRRYEPQNDVWSADFVRDKRWEFQQAREAGYQLILDFGLQYPPDWARAIRPWRDQHGNAYDAQVNAVWSPAVRLQVEQYIDRAMADFGTDFWGIRVGAGGWIESMYPATPAGYAHSYWAFDGDAAAENPVPGWRPGQPSPNGEARRFYEWYVGRLSETINWQHGVVRRHYSGKILQLFAGIGVRPSGYEQLIDDNLMPQPQRIGVDGAARGVVIDRLIDGIKDKRNVVIVSTSLGDGFATAPWLNEASPDPLKWSSAHWVAHNAKRHGLPVWGENTGDDDYANMQVVFKQVSDFGYGALFWAWDHQLYDGKHASIGDYKRMIERYR